MTTLDVDHFRELLVEKREAVAAALENLHKENSRSLEDETGELVSGSADQHLADTATETVEREIGSTLEEHDERLLVAIDAALQRIENGTYGKCVNCGAPIPEERLEAMPWATLCIDCKRKEERG
ncbi:MAG TPA: TraR/DksA C4-type zinc finger protein [Gaiellaceae bacterium]|jgi:RNA polymerase-binding protein DksA|nr:TraR/DksA C4-type zinc finger protein [Gaiellaceae bacterium]